MKTVEKIERKLPVLKTRKRVAAYARVSMESERMQHSLSAQVSYYSALIQKNPEWEYAGVFADYGISGTGTKKRDEFNRIDLFYLAYWGSGIFIEQYHIFPFREYCA